MSQTTLVTGGCGFIGSRLCEILVDKGFKVKVFDNLSTGYKENLSHISDKIELIEGDIRNFEEISAACEGVEVVFHLAALSYVGESVKEPEKYNDVNITGTLNVLKACKEKDVKKYFFPSTYIVYGNPSKTPTPETEIPKPGSPYAMTKVWGEHAAAFFHNQYGLHTTVLRIANAYGPRMQNRAISIFAKLIMEDKPITLHGKGEQKRDFVFVDDIAQGFLKALEGEEKSSGKIYNIGTEEGTTIKHIIDELGKFFGKEVKINSVEAPASEIWELISDSSLAKKDLGYSATYNFETGLNLTLIDLKKVFGKKKS